MRLIEKALLGLTAIGTAGAIGTAAMQGVASGKEAKINQQVKNLKTTSGYIASNYEYKSHQISKLMQDYSLGLISEGVLAECIKEENLTELDFDTYAKNKFSDKEYQEYLRLKEEGAKTAELSKALPTFMIASITIAGMSAGAFTCCAIDGKRKHKQKFEKTHQC